MKIDTQFRTPNDARNLMIPIRSPSKKKSFK
jgi:hypothetical protein